MATHCPYCALQCGMALRPLLRPRVLRMWDDDGEPQPEGAVDAGTDGGSGPAAPGTRLEVSPRTDVAANAGGLCQKGWTAAELLASPERLTRPLMRDRSAGPDAQFRAVSWEVALDRVAGELARVRAARGADAVGVFGGGGLTNEKAYALGKFARVALGTSAIDYNGRWCMSSAAAAALRAFGVDRGLPFPVTDIAQAKTLLLVGANVAETMPPLVRQLTAQKAGGGRLIVIDPRLTPTAKLADLHLQPLPGGDLALAHGILHVLIGEGLVDEAYIAARTTGFADVRHAVSAFWPEQVERVTGVEAWRVREAARMLAGGTPSMVLTARGAEQHAKGVDTVLAFVNIALALGQVGRVGGGYGAITGQGNGQGGREHGQKADQLPGYRRIDDPAARAHVAAVWGVDPDALPGVGPSAYELLDSLGSDVAALLVFGSNPVVSAPRAAHIADRLDSLEFLCVADLVLSETAARADVVLPVTQWAEETGTMTNLEGRVIMRRQALRPPAGVRSDLEVIAALAQRLGRPDGFPTEPAEVFAELARASSGGSADYAGMSHERLAAAGGLFWPCPDPDHPGTPRLFAEDFPTPDGRARFHAVADRASAEAPDEEYPLYLTTGRVLAHYQSGAQTRLVRALREAAPGPFVELHVALARRLNIADGDPVKLTTRRGEAVAPARVTTAIRPDTVFMPFHWAGPGRANTLTNPALDPVSGMPEFKVCAVRVEAVVRTPLVLDGGALDGGALDGIGADSDGFGDVA